MLGNGLKVKQLIISEFNSEEHVNDVLKYIDNNQYLISEYTIIDLTEEEFNPIKIGKEGVKEVVESLKKKNFQRLIEETFQKSLVFIKKTSQEIEKLDEMEDKRRKNKDSK